MAILNDLTDPLVSKILLRLPVKSLMQCICVCKSWYNLVSDQHFIRSHLSLKSADDKEYLVTGFLEDIYTTNCYSFRCDETLVEKLKVNSESEAGFGIAGSCNGLLLMVKLDPSDCDMYLWNPSIGKIKPLPSVHATYKSKFLLEALGLAFLPEASDYKVIRILNLPSDDFSVVDIYSLRDDSWRRIGSPIKRFIPLDDCLVSAAFVYPFLYWAGTGYHDSIITSFNLKSETFTATSLPDACLNFGRLEGFLAVFQESLYLFTTRFGEGRSLWLMKENSSGISCSKICTFTYGFPIGFIRNGHIIIEDLQHGVHLLDPRNVSSPRDLEYEIRWGQTSSELYNYSPSLALLDQRNGGV